MSTEPVKELTDYDQLLTELLSGRKADTRKQIRNRVHHIEDKRNSSIDEPQIFYTELQSTMINSEGFALYHTRHRDNAADGVATYQVGLMRQITDHCRAKLANAS